MPAPYLFPLAVLGLVACIYAFSVLTRPCDPFVSQRARDVDAAAREVFAGAGSYSEFKARVPDTDPVEFSDVRGLARRKRLSPARVQALAG